MDFGDKVGQEVLRLGNLLESLGNAHQKLVEAYKNESRIVTDEFQKVLKVYKDHVNTFYRTNSNDDSDTKSEVIINPSIQEKENAFSGSIPASSPTPILENGSLITGVTGSSISDRINEIKEKIRQQELLDQKENSAMNNQEEKKW